MIPSLLAPVALLVLATTIACGDRDRDTPPDAPAPVVTASAPTTPDPAPVEAHPVASSLVLVAGGDVNLGRELGQELIKNPLASPFAPVASVLDTADVRFVNLECQLSDQRGETQSPENRLIFTGPPQGAQCLARSRIDVVSTANNHQWDYGKKAFFETLDNLERAGVKFAGTGRDLASAEAPVIVGRDGFRLAIFAVTDIWNQGALRAHVAKDHVADAVTERVTARVRELRACAGEGAVDAIAISYHGGEEYVSEPRAPTQAKLRAFVDAGADVVIGHHPHVIQGIEWHAGRPILYSLGNFLFRMASGRPETEFGYLARITFRRGGAPKLEVCPFRIWGIEPKLFTREADPKLRALYENRFFGHLKRISRGLEGASLGAPSPTEGCAVSAPP